MKYHLEVKLPGLPKTTNSTRSFSHWAQHYKEGQKWKRSVIPYLLTKRPEAPLEKAKLTLTRASSQEPDYDGLVSSFKHLIDALVEARIILDDCSSVIGQPTYQWMKAPPNGGFVIMRIEGNIPNGTHK